MARPSTQLAIDKAIQRTPGSIAKQGRGQRSHKERKHFQVYTVSQLLETFRDPRAVLLEIAETDTFALAEKLGCSPIDALAERRLCAQSVLPYVAQKLPIQVDMRHTKAIHLNIVDDRQYAELVQLADDTDDSTMTIEAQLVTEAEPSSVRDVQPTVPAVPTDQPRDTDGSS